MKVIISYPPLKSEKGSPTLGQNRQFQYFKEPTYIYPVVPAQAATLLKDAGYEVIWNDCIADGWDHGKFMDFVRIEKPDLIAFETKTPVVKQHWKIINDIKGLSPKGTDPKNASGAVPKIVLFGDHVTALPEESFRNSQVDFVLTGGDYDFLLKNLCDHLNDPQVILEPGIYYRDNGSIRNTGEFKLDHDLNSLPFIDRELTRWELYAYKNGNYKRTPATYIMSGRDCWYHQCTFCSWPTLYPEFRKRSTENVLDEIGVLINRYNVREVMDDTGTFPVGEWLKEFCNGMIDRGYGKKIYLDCNMRFGALSREDLKLMKQANFRLLLFGLESANQITLDRLNKGLKAGRIIEDCRAATKAGLFPHITIMFGYPWEDYEGALSTLKLGQWLLKKGFAYTMQATLVVPYPGTPLFKECRDKGLLKSLDWDDYDMKKPVIKTSVEDEKIMGLVQGMYKVSLQPEFLLRKLFSLRDIDDLRYALRAGRKVAGHIFDFKR
ncbi:B12-binding domain-containing radical SAM protein [Candidatus Omnitrophota bacterium]